MSDSSMNRDQPELDDYLDLFEIYDKDLGKIYLEPEDERYALLFEQVIRLLIQPSPFNLSLPGPFRLSAHRYHRGDAVTVKHLHHPANRNFMLCDLYDLVMLMGGLARKRRREET